MDKEPNLSKQDPGEIRQHIDETRKSLTEKIETIEDQVRGTIQGAKATVEETIESVKRTFDLKYQTQQHPWPMVGGSFLAGLVLGSLMGGRESPRSPRGRGLFYPAPSPAQESPATRKPDGSTGGVLSSLAASAAPGLLGKLTEQFDDEIRQVKGMAIGAALGVLRDLAKNVLPPALAPQVEQFMNSATTKLGGQPVPGRVLDPSAAGMGQAGREASTTRVTL